MSTTPGRSGPIRCSAPTSSRAPRFCARSRPGSSDERNITVARRARLRERLCAGDAEEARRRRSASARSPILPRHAPRLTIAGDYEFFGRPEWAALRKAYGLSISKRSAPMQPEFMYPAAQAGEVDVISAYTSDGRIARYGLVVLERPASRRFRPTTRSCWSRRSAPTTASCWTRCVRSRRDRRRADARGEPARHRRRRVPRGGRALAMGEDREVMRPAPN